MKYFIAFIIVAIISVAIVNFTDFNPIKNLQSSTQIGQINPTATPKPTLPPLDENSNLADEIIKLALPDTKEDFQKLDDQLSSF